MLRHPIHIILRDARRCHRAAGQVDPLNMVLQRVKQSDQQQTGGDGSWTAPAASQRRKAMNEDNCADVPDAWRLASGSTRYTGCPQAHHHRTFTLFVTLHRCWLSHMRHTV